MHQLGVGVLGPVFRTYDPQHDRLVAVKAFDLDLTPEQADALTNVLQRLVQVGLTNPAIATPLAAGLEEGTPYLAQQYVSGESLDVTIRQSQPATIEEAVVFVSQLAGGIDAAHERAVLHGTLHLRDVFVTADGVKMTGFGVSRALEEVGLRPPVRRPYAAPEIIAGHGFAPEADRFSLAAVAYELLTGKRIAGGGREIIERLKQVDVGQTGDSEALQGVFESGLADDVANRPTSAEHFFSALSSALGVSVSRENVDVRNRGNSQSHKEVSIPRNEPRTGDVPKPQQSAVAPFVKGEIASGTEWSADALEVSERLGSGGDGFLADETSLRPNEESSPEVEASTESAEMVDDVKRKSPRKDAQPLFDFKIGSELPAVGTRMADPLAEAENAVREYSSVSAVDVVLSSKMKSPDELGSVHQPDTSDSSVEESPIFRRYSLPGALQVLVAVSAGVFGAYVLSLFFAIDLPFGDRNEVPMTREEGGNENIETQNGHLADIDGLDRDAGLENNLTPASEMDDLSRSTSELESLLLEQSSVPGGVPEPALLLDTPTTEPLPAASSALRGLLGTEDSADEAFETQGGWILVKTNPPNAIVTVDGINRGQTPLSLRDVEYGSHRVVISASGYQSQARDVVVSSEATIAAVSAQLARESTQRLEIVNGIGAVFVNSSPTGATVLVDDVDVGFTPVLISDLESGDHAVRIEVDGYEAWATTVNVFPAERTQVEAALIPGLR